jgi:hypothetical protein
MTCNYEPKRLTEKFWLSWAVCWVLSFGLIVGLKMYEWFDAVHYLVVCGGLSAPLLLQPLLLPGITGEENTSLENVRLLTWDLVNLYCV